MGHLPWDFHDEGVADSRRNGYYCAMGTMAPPSLSPDWRTVDPDEAGLAGHRLRQLTEAVAAAEFSGLHALLILYHGKIAHEQYFPGQDEHWGQKLGSLEHGPTLLHDLRSVTKSIVGLLYGQALHGGLVPPTSAKLFDALPEYADLATGPLKRRISIGHTLSMRMGLAWHEDFAYGAPENGEFQMEQAADRYRHILGLPMADKPGARWVYCGGATALLGHLIAKGTGRRLEDYARDKLFTPLGIGRYEWVAGSDGFASASSGLRLTARDLARIGQMVLDKGFWHGRRIVPSAWLVTSMKLRTYAESGLRYGYHWWLGQLAATGKPWHAAFGNGGQRLIVIPSLNMVVVILAGNYNRTDQWKMPLKLMTRIVMPAVSNG